MSTHTLAIEAMSLSLAERVELAQALWASIDSSLRDSTETASILDACRRNAELESGNVSPISHADAMKAARQAIGCK